MQPFLGAAAGGTVVLSVDVSLGWGCHHLDRPPARRLDAARQGWETALGLFEAADLPATWALVGHLYRRTCDGRHADHPAPVGWFDHERRPNPWSPDLRYGNGLVDAVRDAGPAHELACQPFSRLRFDDPRASAAFARAETVASVDAARDRGVTVTSFAFPGDAVAHRDAVADAGLCCYRAPAPAPRFDVGPVRPLRRFARAVAGWTPPAVEPSVDDRGLVRVPTSLDLFDDGPAGAVRGDRVVEAARRGVDAAAREGRVCHLQFDTNDLVTVRDVDRVRAVLEHVSRRRDEGAVRVQTLHEVATRAPGHGHGHGHGGGRSRADRSAAGRRATPRI